MLRLLSYLIHTCYNHHAYGNLAPVYFGQAAAKLSSDSKIQVLIAGPGKGGYYVFKCEKFNQKLRRQGCC